MNIEECTGRGAHSGTCADRKGANVDKHSHGGSQPLNASVHCTPGCIDLTFYWCCVQEPTGAEVNPEMQAIVVSQETIPCSFELTLTSYSCCVQEPTGAEINPEMQAIVVSQETIPGATAINEGRKRRGYQPLQVSTVAVFW